MESEMLSEKGKRLILIDGYTFSYHKNLAAGCTRWKCVKRPCKAFLKRNVHDLLIPRESNLNHSCQVNTPNIIVRQRISNSMKGKAYNTFRIRPSTLISGEVQGKDADILTMDDITRIRKNIHAARVKDYKLPKDINEVHELLDGLKVTTNCGENMVYYNEDAGDGDHIIIFTCHSNLAELKAADTIYVDGTFRSSPKFFEQMFSLHILKNGWYAPLVFCLLPDKHQSSYVRAFSVIREYVLASTIYADFEQAIHSAVREVWPHVTVRGCRFHLGQSWWRAIQRFHLAEIYKDKMNEDNKILKYVFGLPFLRSADVEDAFAVLMEVKPATKEMDNFFDYLLENYITEDSLFPPSLWADMSFMQPRTTNCCEAFHSKFNAEFHASKPNIYSFIDALKCVQGVTYIKLRSHKERPQREIFKQEELERKIREFETDRDILKYLNAVCYKFLPNPVMK